MRHLAATVLALVIILTRIDSSWELPIHTELWYMRWSATKCSICEWAAVARRQHKTSDCTAQNYITCVTLNGIRWRTSLLWLTSITQTLLTCQHWAVAVSPKMLFEGHTPSWLRGFNVLDSALIPPLAFNLDLLCSTGFRLLYTQAPNTADTHTHAHSEVWNRLTCLCTQCVCGL